MSLINKFFMKFVHLYESHIYYCLLLLYTYKHILIHHTTEKIVIADSLCIYLAHIFYMYYFVQGVFCFFLFLYSEYLDMSN